MKTFASSSIAAYLYGILTALALLLTASVADAATQNLLIGTWQGTDYEGRYWSTLTINSDYTASRNTVATNGSWSTTVTTSPVSGTTNTSIITSVTCTGNVVCPTVGTTSTGTLSSISGSGIGRTMVETYTDDAGFIVTFTFTKISEPQNPLVGTWQGTLQHSVSDTVWTNTLTINSDNTYYGTGIAADGNGSQTESGTYSYSSTTLTVTNVSSTCTGSNSVNCTPAGLIETVTYAISGSGIGSTLTITKQNGSIQTFTKISEPSPPVTQPPAMPPTCTLTASPASIAPGGISTLTARCNPAATSYAWSGTCVGDTGATCTVTPSVTTTY